MAENPPLAAATHDPPSRLREWLTSIVLIVFTSAVGFACVLVLASTLTQGRMAGLNIEGVNISIWKLDYIRQQWADIREHMRRESDDLAGAEQRRGELSAQLIAVEAKYQSALIAFAQLLDEFNSRIRPLDAVLAESMNGKDPAQQHGNLLAAQDELLKRHPELAPLAESIGAAHRAFRPISGERAARQAANQAVIAEIETLQDGLKSGRTSLDALFAQISTRLDETNRSRIENALYELHAGRGPLAKFINRLVTTPPDILTLGLVILMGVLGSALQMTYALFKRNRVERPGAYFLRLSVGAITALVIFIVAKAGVPIVADASRMGGDAPINPYFVSFLAIISGLMSENAIHSVQAQGARLFANEETPEPLRWARFDLREAFRQANRDPEKVKRLLNAEDGQFDAWIGGEESIPGNVQTMLAGVLERPRRELFSDLPPDGKEAAA